MRQPAHITINGRPFCGWTGCLAGMDIQRKVERANTGAGLPPVLCGHTSLNRARRVAQALRPHFVRGAVAVVAGDCPEMTQ